MSQAIPEKDASIRSAIESMRADRPLRAEETCRDYLGQHPGCTDHLRLLGHALMKQNRLPEAEEKLRFALSLNEQFPQLHEDLGSVLALQNQFEEAILSFERAIQLHPSLPLAHKKLGKALAAVGRGAEADEAFERYSENDPDRTELTKGVEHLRADEADEAIPIFKRLLKRNPDDVNALRYLAAGYWQKQIRLEDAEALLRRATQIADDYTQAWLILGSILINRNEYMEAIRVYRKATDLEPRNPEAWSGLGNAYSIAMYPEKSIQAFERSLALNAKQPQAQMGYAHSLKTVGKQAESIQAYRTAVKLKPDFGEVYWSMANLKIFNFEEEELNNMLQQLERDDLSTSADIHFRFALGKAFEDEQDYDRAWHHYHTGNQRQRMTLSYDPVSTQRNHNAVKKVFNKIFLSECLDYGYEAHDPIFIVGLPRSGSTLVEQILASHSQVEGTSELPILGRIASSIGRYRTDGIDYPEAVKDLRKKDWRAYGQQYIEESQRHRVTDKPFFTDKLPNNFTYVGFASLILPNAKVINARRHPFDSCLGGYKQLFGSGQNFTYDMLDLAHYYQQYDAMIKHWHEAMPGKVLDVHYEETVTNLADQVRRILEHCGLPFEESCVRFHETDRAVKTASSEQVRQPIYTAALGTWRRYEKHLDLWHDQLGYIVEELPEVARNAGL